MSSESEYDEARSWLLKFHAAGDALDAKNWTDNYYTDDAALTFANYPTVRGSGLESMKHRIVRLAVLPDRIYQPAEITYIVKDDPEKKEITILGFAIFVRDEERQKVKDFIVYLDPAPINERKVVVEELKNAGHTVVKG